MNLFSDYPLLLLNLRKLSNEPDRSKASTDIKVLVEAAARELSLERFENFERDLFQVFYYHPTISVVLIPMNIDFIRSIRSLRFVGINTFYGKKYEYCSML